MKDLRTALIGSLALFAAACLSGCGQAGGPNNSGSGPKGDGPDGTQVVGEFLKRDAAPFRKMRVRFTIKAEGEPDKIYELDNWRKQTPEGTTTLSQIIKPAEDSDLASLTLEPKGEKTTVVNYIASRNEFRETDTNKMFFGGLTAGELLGEWEKFDFRLLGEKEADGRKVFEVDGKLKSTASSVIARKNVLFRADNYLPVEIRLFDSTGREIRSSKATEFNDDPVRPYVVRTEVDNPVYKSHVVIEILSREFPDSIDDSMFAREKLKQIVRK